MERPRRIADEDCPSIVTGNWSESPGDSSESEKKEESEMGHSDTATVSPSYA